MVQKNGRFFELSAERSFPLQNRLIAIRYTRFEKRSSIYSDEHESCPGPNPGIAE